ARWDHPTRGVLAPASFLAIAEGNGMSTALDTSILRAALADVAALRASHPSLADVTVSVNASVHHLMSPGFVTAVESVIADAGVAAEAVCIAITETGPLTRAGTAGDNLRALHAAGVRFSVDDFGAGYAPLTYLRELPVAAVKIDRSFVAGLGRRHDDTALVG